MYHIFLLIHSFLRWAVLFSLLYVIFSHLAGWFSKRVYSKADNLAQSIAKSLTEIQLLLGFVLYFVFSPITQIFFKNGLQGSHEIWFFGIYHIAMMFLAVVMLNIGSAVAKRAQTDAVKFKNIVIYFSVTLLLIILAIPWFRPLLRDF